MPGRGSRALARRKRHPRRAGLRSVRRLRLPRLLSQPLTPLRTLGFAQSLGGVAQLGERLLCKQEVVGSIPITSTTARMMRSIIRCEVRQRRPCAARAQRFGGAEIAGARRAKDG